MLSFPDAILWQEGHELGREHWQTHRSHQIGHDDNKQQDVGQDKKEAD